jgi:HSP20 family protein
MLSMTRWNPFEELTSLHREMDRVFGSYAGDERAGAPAAWIPATEVNSSEDGWKVRVALPGIDPQNVHIDLHGNSLTISGERARREPNGQGYTSEFRYGSFERAFTLPAKVDAEKVVASYDNGMLELSLPLAEAARPRRIAIGMGASPAGAGVEHAA